MGRKWMQPKIYIYGKISTIPLRYGNWDDICTVPDVVIWIVIWTEPIWKKSCKKRGKILLFSVMIGRQGR
jgi:hypothetical protein